MTRIAVLLLYSCLVSTLPAQTRTIAERLGYPANAKLLILHGDDLGFAHSANAATFDGLDKGVLSSASIMMPTPWITEVAAYARAHPNADLGLHLTLTSEWLTYRWGSVAPSDKVASLLDSAGMFPGDVEVVVKNAKLAEVEHELRAQIERARAVGIRPTHLDSHMGSLFPTPELMATLIKVAREYGLPFLAVQGGAMSTPLGGVSDKDIIVNTLITIGPDVPPDQWKTFYLNAIANLKPGLTEILVHFGYDDAELRAVTVNHDPWGSAWRQRDYDALSSPEFRKALQDNKVIVVTWRDLARAARQP